MTQDASVESQNGLHDPDSELLSGPDDPTTWVSHPVDIRISIPFVRERYYFTVVAGKERRRKDRRQADRHANPLLTFGNLFFTLGLVTMLTVVALIILIAQSAIIQ